MIQLIRKILLELIERIDAGNSNINEEEGKELLSILTRINSKDEGMSKYSACSYLNISRASFDNLVREGKLPRGTHHQGFKELRWYKRDLDIIRNDNKEKCKDSNI